MTSSSSAERKRLLILYTIEGLLSAAATLLTVGVFFYTSHEFGWGMKRNFALSAGQGLVYVVAALVASPLTLRFGRRAPLAVAFIACGAAMIPAALHTTPAIVATAILFFTALTGCIWPIMESLVSAGNITHRQLSNRITIYNIVWAGTGGIIVAANGLMIKIMPSSVLLTPLIACLGMGLLAMISRIEPADSVADSAHDSHAEDKLLQQRTLALRLSRISVPAMYLGIFAMSAMFPALPALRPYRTETQTLIGSVWLIARWVGFIFLGFTVFWHTRPQLLIGAVVILMAGFLLITFRPMPFAEPMVDLLLIIIGQILFGAATAMIYMASLYFGMALSEGSTEHGGYHEALIGLGMALGPGAGLISQWLWPGSQLAAANMIGGLLLVTLLIAGWAALRARR
jgi:hypothetical protein